MWTVTSANADFRRDPEECIIMGQLSEQNFAWSNLRVSMQILRTFDWDIRPAIFVVHRLLGNKN